MLTFVTPAGKTIMVELDIPPRTVESDENGHLINQYNAKRLIYWSIVMVVIGIVCLFIPLQSLLIVAVLTVVVLTIPLIQTLRYARHL